MTRTTVPTCTRLPLLLALLALAACGPSDGNNDNQNNDNQNGASDAGLDAALQDGAAGDAALTDAGSADGAIQDAGTNLVWDAAGTTHWELKAVNSLLLTEPTVLTAHPSATTTLAALPAATETNNNMVVFRTSDGLTWNPVTILSFTATPGFFGAPYGLAYDPRAPDYLVAALKPVPPPNSGLAMVLAWSDNGGSSFTHPWNAWTSPWPPDEMHYVDGVTPVLIWRAGASFYYESGHGTTFSRTETLTLPAGCTGIAGFDVPRNDHDAVTIWCDGVGGAHHCDVTQSSCTALPVSGPVRFLAYGPLDPMVLYVLTTDSIYRSNDGGSTFDHVHFFGADVVKVDPQDSQTACALHRTSGELRCTRDDGATWMDLTPPDLQGPTPTEILDFAFTADGHLWAIAHPGIIHHPAP